MKKTFTGKNTIHDILQDTFLMERFYKLLPDDYVYLVPEDLRDEPIETLSEKVKMPWGGPYMSEAIVDAANKVYRLAYDERYEFIPLWTEEEKNYFPLGNEEKDVCLVRVKDSFAKGRPLALVVPGGSYHDIAMTNEGMDIADEMMQRGYAVAILYYRVAPNRYPLPQMDLALAIKYLRAHQEAYGVQNHILAMGFSAGGHLVASQACYGEEIEAVLKKTLQQKKPTLYNRYYQEHNGEKKDAQKKQSLLVKPDQVCLAYPVINCITEHHEDSYLNLSGGGNEMRDKLSIDLHVTSAYPQTFVWACDDDGLVPSSNAKRLYAALQKAGVESRLEIYPTGNHGVGVGTGTSAQGWLDTMVEYMTAVPKEKQGHLYKL